VENLQDLKKGAYDYRLLRRNGRSYSIEIEECLTYLDAELNKNFGKGLDELLPSLRSWIGNGSYGDQELAVALLPNDPDSNNIDATKQVTVLQLWDKKKHIPSEHRILFLSLAIQRNPNLKIDRAGGLFGFDTAKTLYTAAELNNHKNLDYTIPTTYKNRFIPVYEACKNDKRNWIMPAIFLVPGSPEDIIYWRDSTMWAGASVQNMPNAALRVRGRVVFLEQYLDLMGVL